MVTNLISIECLLPEQGSPPVALLAEPPIDSNPFETVVDVSDAVGDFVVTYGPVGVPGLAAGAGGLMILRYRHRRSVEARITAADRSMTNLDSLRIPKGQNASEVHPAMPAVTVRRVRAKQLLSRMKSAELVWHYAGEDLDEPHVVIVGRSGVGKNETLLDPAVRNAIFHRSGAVIVNDVKGAVFRKFTRRIPHPQYVYTFDPRHKRSAAINLIETPEMARRTATALYSLQGEKVKIYNRSARALFVALAEHLGHGRSNIVEIYRLASDRRALERLAEQNARIGGIIGGENKTLVGDIVSSLTAPLEPLEEPSVARVFASQGSQPDLAQNIVVWIIIPEGMEEDLGPLAGAVLRTLYERAKVAPEPVRIFVDEAGSCLALDDLARYLAVARGAGVHFALVLQDLSQLAAKIGWENTRSVLGSAGVHFWGPTNDPETARYVSALSGTTEVATAVFEHHGFIRKYRQFVGNNGAPYELRYYERDVILPEHVTGCPKGWWYRYAGDPHRIELVIPAPMYEWPKGSRPEKVKPRYRGAPRQGSRDADNGAENSNYPSASAPTGSTEGELVASDSAAADHGRREPQGQRPRCDNCKLETEEAWSWCPDCGARLPGNSGSDSQ